MLKSKPKLKDSVTYKFLDEYNSHDNTIVAHNAKYDLKMLSACGFEWYGDVVDTLRCTKHLIQECEQFSLQFLRYELKLYKTEEKETKMCNIKEKLLAHNALSDALHVKLLYEYLLEIQAHEKLIELSAKNVLIQKFEFGKHSGKYIEDISINDRGYLEWMLSNIMDLDEDLRYSIEYYLQGNG
jgi:DNA polymerase-3 subunit epsilon/exodeoxyribonuclease X